MACALQKPALVMAGNSQQLAGALFGLQQRIARLTDTIRVGTPDEIRAAAVERDRALDRLAWTVDFGVRQGDIHPHDAAAVRAYIAERRAEEARR